MSVDVCTLTPIDPTVIAPITKPDIVTVKYEAGIGAPPVAIKSEVAVVGLQVPVSADTLLLPAATMGVTEDAKKPTG